MSTAHLVTVLSLLSLASATDPSCSSGGAPSSALEPESETLDTADGVQTVGRLSGDPAKGFVFNRNDGGPPIRIEPGMTLRFESLGPPASTGLPPFKIDLGLGQRISGRLSSINERGVVLLDALGDGKVSIARGGARSVVQRPGETLVLQDGFETLDTRRWVVVGEPDVVDSPRLSGGHSLRLPAGGASLTYRVPEPFGSGRLEAAFHDAGASAPDQKWFVDLTFRGATGPETVRAVLGWAEASLAVETLNGPALAVQRLARSAGWHRLSLRFGPDRCEVSVDGNELAHGKGFGGPLAEVRLATSNPTKKDAPENLAASLDDLKLIRFAEPVGDFEIDASQDEVRLTGGDQIYGRVTESDADRVAMNVDGRDATLPWSEVSGLYFRRDPVAGAPVLGLLVQLEWKSAPGNDPRDLDRVEGALTGVSPTSLALATPYAGVLHVPRDRVTSMRIQGRGARTVLDNAAHHMGDSISTMPPLLDPPQPEGGVLERSFELDPLPAGPLTLVLDVVQVVGESAELPFSALIKKGELRTNVSINGSPFDYVNHYIFTRNETPERVRLTVPKALLRKGKNVFRFEQVGIASDPNYLDDLGLLGIAVEFDPALKSGAK